MEPKRWIGEHPSLDIRQALRAGVELEPPPGAAEVGWKRLSATLGAAAAVTLAAEAMLGKGTAASTSLAAGSTGALPATLGPLVLAKWFGGGVGAAMLVLGAGAALEPSIAPWSSARPPVGITARANSSRSPDERALPSSDEPEVARPAEPSGTAGPVTPSADPARRPETKQPLPPSSTVSRGGSAAPDEATLVLHARDALRRGDSAEALRTLGVAKGLGRQALAQERLALEIAAWQKAGATERAKRLARTFLELYPESPHSPGFRELAP